MSSLVKVAIVGRPNVGKSTLFNLLTGQRRSVVQDRPGVTRDLIFGVASAWERDFEIIDTGGLTDAGDEISLLIKKRVKQVLSEVDLALVVVDGRDGITSDDEELISLVQQSSLETLMVVNKIDRVEDENVLVSEFYKYGLDLIPCSFDQRRGVSDLLEWLHSKLPEEVAEEAVSFPKIAIVGKPNVGKSSLLNRLADQERALVSTIAGTTIDAVDVDVDIEGQNFTIIDTAGMRRHSRRSDDLEKVSAVISEKSIKRANLVLLMIDAEEGPSDQDARILQMILENDKGVILVANKSDLAKTNVPAFRSTFKARVQQVFHFFPNIWVHFISVKTGQGMIDLFKKVKSYQEKLDFRVTTSELNDYFMKVIREAPAPVYGTKTVKFYYLTQTRQTPPSFIAFANHPKGVDNSYRRFLSKRIQKKWGLEGVPVRIFVTSRGAKRER